MTEAKLKIHSTSMTTITKISL